MGKCSKCQGEFDYIPGIGICISCRNTMNSSQSSPSTTTTQRSTESYKNYTDQFGNKVRIVGSTGEFEVKMPFWGWSKASFKGKVEYRYPNGDLYVGEVHGSSYNGKGKMFWKSTELGGKVVTISGPDGYIYDKDGVNTEEKINFMLEMRASCRNRVQDYADKFGVPFFKGEKPWGVKADILMPCATQNEVREADAEKIIANGVKYYVEVSNMPTTNEAIAMLKAAGVIVAPSKAVNAGGVATSGLEMSQNSMRYSWTAEEVDAKLKMIMKNIFDASVAAANKYGLGDDLVAGANIAGFLKVADAMKAQGVC